jgi:hypothetical protein
MREIKVKLIEKEWCLLYNRFILTTRCKLQNRSSESELDVCVCVFVCTVALFY